MQHWTCQSKFFHYSILSHDTSLQKYCKKNTYYSPNKLRKHKGHRTSMCSERWLWSRHYFSHQITSSKITANKPTHAKFIFLYAWRHDKSTIPYNTINYFTIIECFIHHFYQWIWAQYIWCWRQWALHCIVFPADQSWDYDSQGFGGIILQFNDSSLLMTTEIKP